MKKNLLLIISLIFLLGIGSTYAEVKAATYDFEDGKLGSSGVTTAVVDEAHGKSFKIGQKNAPTYTFPETVSTGKYLISFEVYFDNHNQDFRFHMKSPKDNDDGHSIIYFSKGGKICPADGSTSWSFTTNTVTDYDVKKWYQIDILIDFDDMKISHYVDGVNYSTKTLGLESFSNVTFRSESVVAGSNANEVIYMDNLTLKYVSLGSFDTSFKNKTADEDGDTVDIEFSDLIDKESLSGIKVYNMGNNPVSYSAREVSYEMTNVESKKVTLKLSEKFGQGNIFKIYAPGAKSLFGDEYSNDAAYFSSGGVTGLAQAVNADFSTIATVGVTKKINPTSDAEWDRSRSKYVYPINVTDLNDAGSEIAVVKMAQVTGTESDFISRTFDTAYTGYVGMGYKIKAKNGNQYFTVTDSEGNAMDIVTIKQNGIYCGDKKIADYTADTWFTVKVEADFDTHKAKILINGDVTAESADITSIKDLKKVTFRQENREEGLEKADCAESHIAYFNVLTVQPCSFVTLVSFEDKDGNLYYPDEKIPSDVEKMHVKFSEDMNETSIKSGISLTFGSDKETFSGSYDSTNKDYVVTLSEYLAGGEKYRLRIYDSVKSTAKRGLKEVDGYFETDKGLVRAESFTFEKNGGNVDLAANILHTDKSCPKIYLIYAAYDDDMVIDFKYTEIAPSKNERNIPKSISYSYPAEADTVSAFLWNGFDKMIPMARMKTAE